MAYYDRPPAGQQGSCARDSRLTTIRMNDRSTKNPAEVAGSSNPRHRDEGGKS